MYERKPWWQSKTIIGAAATLLASALHMTGLPISDVDVEKLANGIVDIMGILGGLLAIYGRRTATKALH